MKIRSASFALRRGSGHPADKPRNAGIAEGDGHASQPNPQGSSQKTRAAPPATGEAQ